MRRQFQFVWFLISRTEMSTHIILGSLKQIVPAPLKRAARDMQSQLRLRRAIERIANLPAGEVPTVEMLSELQAGWANDGFAARIDLLMEVAQQAATTDGAILECGSGITTILMGLLAGRRGVKTYSLEHIDEWRTRVLKAVSQFRIPNVEILHTPLCDFDGFAWYDAPLADLPAQFSFVLSDGPPGETRGGRYGLLPVMRDRLAANAVIILDDTEREGELQVLRRWQNESSLDLTMHESSAGSFAVLRLASPITTTDFQTPKVSIIIPAYNIAPYIADTLDSVFKQTFTDYEVIVVNDGSPDTGEFENAIQAYSDRIVYLQQENGGASVARNAGLQAARGEFVAFLDGDDVWLPNYLEEQMKFMQTRGCDLACADAIFFGDTADKAATYMIAWMDDAPDTGDFGFLELVDAKRSVITSGVVARRQSVIDIGLFDPELRRGQDFDLWLRLASTGHRLSFQRKPLLKYRCRPNSLSGGVINSHRRELRIFDKIEQSYDLSPAQRTEVAEIIRKRRALLQFEMGKLYAARGSFHQAQESFVEANRLQPNLKGRVALSLIRLAPQAVRAICARRYPQS
jgi:glycosyltransferase involved in cell wall biosynthesis